MNRFLLARLLQSIVVLWAVATLTFILMHIVPGGPFDRERRLPPDVMANITAKYHLDEPMTLQYWRFLKQLLRGDLGPSYKYTDRDVNSIVAQTLPVSALLGLLALLLAVGVSLTIGVCAASVAGSPVDRWSMFAVTLGISLPNFVLGAILIWIFSLKLGWLQPARWGQTGNMILPTITLGAAPAAYLTYLLRASMVETLGEDFITTARAKGLGEAAVLLKHALRNSLIPFLTVLGPVTAALVTGSFVVEYIFAIPGMGRFYITAVIDRDYPMIMGVTLVYTALLVAANFVVDLAYSWIDPRIKVH